jgi:cytochrome P450
LLDRVRAEVLQTANKHSQDESVPLLQKLSELPMEAWETGFPLTEVCLRESMRLQLHGTGFRRNVSDKPVAIGDNKVVPPGAFLVHHFGAQHVDPNIWHKPHDYDPDRFLSPREEDKKTPNAFVGWGAGRHPCLGMRFAKLEQNLMTAFFVTMFDFETEKPLPAPDVNNWNASQPTEQILLKISVRKEG